MCQLPVRTTSEPRYSVRLHGDVTVYQPVEVRELGSGSMLVESRFPLHLDSLHDFRLALGPHSVVVKGRVAESRISELEQDVLIYQTVVEFVALAPTVAAVIGDFLAARGARDTG